MNRKVVAAACKQGDIILVGVSHFDTWMLSQLDAMKSEYSNMSPAKWIQGFIDNRGNFLTREEAMILVKESGQEFDIERNGGQDKKLYSEGVW